MANNQPNPNSEQRVSDTIAQAAVRGKFLDFRNNLQLANPNDYAMLHGAGGAKHATKSTITLLITDYSAGANGTITVRTNVAPELIPYLLEVCKQNVSVASTTTRPMVPACVQKVRQLCMGTALPPNNGVVYVACPVSDLQALPGLDGFTSKGQEVYGRLQQAALPLPPDTSGAAFVAVPKDGLLELEKAIVPSDTDASQKVGGVNFSYRQERVNVYKQENGLVPVSVLSISREGTRKSGEVSRLPWTVKITQFMAPPLPQKNGTTAYNSQGKQQVTEAFVSLSDFDMFRCLHRVERFIEVWEVTYGMGLICDGMKRKEEFRNSQQGSTSPEDYGYPPDYPNY